MGSVSDSADLKCDLCMSSAENRITGALETKAGIVAHQKCLLYASGIYCKNSPPHDDLFGFDVDDVKAELKRGKKLKCSRCKERGATAGCEVKKCKRSYHYPCAMVAQAKAVEKRGCYMLYCPEHASSNDILEWSKNIKNRKLSSGASEAHNSVSTGKDSDASDMENMHPGSKSGFGTPLRARKRKYRLHSSDDEAPCSIDPIHAPLESDLEDVTPPVLERQSTPDPGDNSFDEEPKPSTSGDTPADSDETCSDLGHDSDSLLPSEYRQENVPVTVITDSGPSETSPGPISPYSPGPCTLAVCISPLSETDDFNNDTNILLNPSSPAPPSVKEPSTATEQCENPHPVREHVDPVLNMSLDLDISHHHQLLQTTASAGDSFAPPQATESLGEVDVSDSSAALFWRRCNEEGYTEYIFTELKHQLSDLAERVQNQSATQQDYNISLRILKASGRLPTIFKQLTQDLDEQEIKLSRKREALRDARAALGHNHVI